MKRICVLLVSLGLYLIFACPATAGVIKAELFQYRIGQQNSGEASLIIKGVNGLRGTQAKIAYDPGVIQIEDADFRTPGIQVTAGSLFQNTGMVINEVDPAKGVIQFSAASPGQEASGTIEVLKFNYRYLNNEDPQITVAGGGVVIADSQMKEIRVSATTVNQMPPKETAVIKKVSQLPAEKAADATTQPAVKATKNATEKTVTNDSEVLEKSLVIIGGILLLGFIIDYLYRRQRRRRKHRR